MAGPITKTPVEIIFDKGQSNDEMLRAEQLSPRSVINGLFDGRGSLRQMRKAVATSAAAGSVVGLEAFQQGNQFYISGNGEYKRLNGTAPVTTLSGDGSLYGSPSDLMVTSKYMTSFGIVDTTTELKTRGDFDILTDANGTFQLVAQENDIDTNTVGAGVYCKVVFKNDAGVSLTTVISQTLYSLYKPRLCYYKSQTSTSDCAVLYLWRSLNSAPTTASIVAYPINISTGVVGAQSVIVSFTAISNDYLGRMFDASWFTTSGTDNRIALSFRYSIAGTEYIWLGIMAVQSYSAIGVSNAAAPAVIGSYRALFVKMSSTIATVVYTAGQYVRKMKLSTAGAFFAEATVGDTGSATRLVGRIVTVADGVPGTNEYSYFDWHDTTDGSTGVMMSSSLVANTTAGTSESTFAFGVIGTRPIETVANFGTATQFPFIVNGHALAAGLYGDTESSLDILSFGVSRLGTGYLKYPRVMARLAFGEHLVVNKSSLHYMSRLPNAFISGVPSARISRSVETAGSLEVQQNFRFDVVISEFTSLRAAGSRRNSVQVEQNLLVAGAVPTVIDGFYDRPSGFSARLYVFGPTISTVGAPGNITAGLHRFKVVATFVNENGAVQIGEPSNWLAVTAVAGNNNISFTVNRTDNGLIAQTATLRMYRTTIDDLNTYYLDDLSNHLSDADLVYGAQLPTTGGVLPTEPAPPCTFLAIHQNRVFACGGEFGDELYFTHELQPGFLPEWSQTFLFRRAPKDFGRLVSMVSIDDRLVVFGEHKIGIISGTGPDRTGAGDGYSQIQAVVGNYGCHISAPTSPVPTENGIWFQAARGMRFLGRGLQIEKDSAGNWLGDSLDNIFDAFGWDGVSNNYVASGNTKARRGPRRLMGLAAKSKELIYWVPAEFWTSDATVTPVTYNDKVIEAICFDTRTAQWTVRSSLASDYPGPSVTSSGYVFSGYVGAGIITTTNSDQSLILLPNEFFDMKPWYDDDTQGAPSVMTVDTGWLGFAKVSGFQRVYDVTVLLRDAEDGTYANPSDANVTVDSPQTCNLKIETSTDFNSNSWTTVFNANAPVKSTNTFVREVTCQLPVQKCESIRLRLTISGTTHPVRLTSARLTVGVKEGRNKGSLGRS